MSSSPAVAKPGEENPPDGGDTLQRAKPPLAQSCGLKCALPEPATCRREAGFGNGTGGF